MQFEIDKKNEFIRNLITIGTFSINFIGCVYFTIKSFDFDKESTMTSTMGRGILSNLCLSCLKNKSPCNGERLVLLFVFK